MCNCRESRLLSVVGECIAAHCYPRRSQIVVGGVSIVLLNLPVRTVRFISHGISCMSSCCYAMQCHGSQNVHRSTCHDSSHVHTFRIVTISNRCPCVVLHFMALVQVLTRSVFQGHVHDVVHSYGVLRVGCSVVFAVPSPAARLSVVLQRP